MLLLVILEIELKESLKNQFCHLNKYFWQYIQVKDQLWSMSSDSCIFENKAWIKL